MLLLDGSTEEIGFHSSWDQPGQGIKQTDWLEERWKSSDCVVPITDKKLLFATAASPHRQRRCQGKIGQPVIGQIVG